MALPTRVNRGTAYDPFELAQREFDNMLGRFLGGYGGRTGEAHAALAPYGVDVREDADHIYVEAELPGFRKEDVDITLENNTLTIQGERKFEKEEKEENFHRIERRYGSFVRTFKLPNTVDAEKVEASYDKGILKITLAKRAEAKPRQIKVGIGQKTLQG